MTDQNQFDEIIWPENPVLSDPNKMKRAIDIVRMLCNIGHVTFWQECSSGYAHMAFHYEVKGIQVRFFPHWGFYTIGMLDFDLPQTEADILATVEAYKVLQAHGLKTKR